MKSCNYLNVQNIHINRGNLVNQKIIGGSSGIQIHKKIMYFFFLKNLLKCRSIWYPILCKKGILFEKKLRPRELKKSLFYSVPSKRWFYTSLENCLYYFLIFIPKDNLDFNKTLNIPLSWTFQCNVNKFQKV